MIEEIPQEQDLKEKFANQIKELTEDKHGFTFDDAERLKNMILTMQEPFPTDTQRLDALLDNISIKANELKQYFQDEETAKMYGTDNINEIGDKFSLKHFAKHFRVIF